MDMRVFWSVLAALLIFGAVVVGWRAWERHRDIEDARAIMSNITDTVSQAVQQSQVQSADILEQRRRVAEFQLRQSYENDLKRVLSPNQRCVGGIVVEVNGSTYTQVGSISRPVHCVDGMADRAIR
jgi:Flp pilus assembly protein TadB